MEKRTLAARLSDDAWTRLLAEPGETPTAKLHNLIARSARPEDPAGPPEAATEPPASPAAPAQEDDTDDQAAQLDRAAADAVSDVAGLLISPKAAALRLRQHLVSTNTGEAAIDLGDGSPPVPLDPETVAELLADQVMSRGSAGSGGHGKSEFKTPPRVEPPPFRGLIKVTGTPSANFAVCDTRAYDALSEREKRAFNEEAR